MKVFKNSLFPERNCVTQDEVLSRLLSLHIGVIVAGDLAKGGVDRKSRRRAWRAGLLAGEFLKIEIAVAIRLRRLNASESTMNFTARGANF